MRKSRRELCQWAAVVVSGLVTRTTFAEASPPLVILQPLGAATPTAEIEAVSAALTAFYRIKLEVAAPLPLPQAAFYAKRQRYRAERLLDHLANLSAPGAKIVLGLTAVDISTTKGAIADWGILGLATLDGRSAVLSSFRCKRGAKNAAHVRARFSKTAVHELGHSFGLEHCTTPGCIMHDGEGSVLTTDGERDLCPETRARLAALGVLRDAAVSPFT